MVVRNLFLTIGLVLLFSSCASVQEDIKSVLQTSKASNIKDDYKTIQNLLIDFKTKLDKRNPNKYSKSYEQKIYRLLRNNNPKFLLNYKNSVLENYRDYLQLAFSQDNIANRADYLVLGIHYLLYTSYEIDDEYKVTALQYDKEKLNILYKNLQIIKWKVRVAKDLKGDYLFLTWQNNWQIELEKKLQAGEKLSYEELQKLKFIKEQRESMLDSSNFSFEVILSKMIHRVENSLKALGQEPKELSVSAIKSMFLFF